eukprot:312145_1
MIIRVMSQQKISKIYPIGHTSIAQKSQSIKHPAVNQQKCQDDIVRLRDAIDALKEQENKTILQQQAKSDSKTKLPSLPPLQFVAIKRFEGHSGKIYDSDWSTDCRLLLSGSNQGHLMVWDSQTTHKKLDYQL